MEQDTYAREVATHRPYLVRVAQSILRCDVELAEDTVQTALARVQPEQIDEARGPCRAYLVRAVKWEAFKCYRQGHPYLDEYLEDDHALPPVAPTQEDDYLSVELEEAVVGLPPHLRRVVVLWLEGYNFKEIGVLQGYSWQNARQLWQRAVRLLRERWDG